jgi:hypothetical protein
VFLRVMEYYNGILFLTTNRPGQLDEAIKSRVHSALLYQTLSLQQTLEIFRMNIERLELIEKQRRNISDPPQGYLQADKTGILAFAEKHWRQHEFDELGRWNGRQIRNAFISAAALARGDLDDNAGDGRTSVAVLTERHFQDVATSVTAFDKYMARARGGLDSERARTRSDRPDYFVLGEEPETPARNRRASRNSTLTRPSLSSSGAGGQHHTPTPSPRHHYAPVSPTPSYYIQPAQTLSAAGQQPFGGDYGYPVQGYGTAAAVPAPVWPLSAPQAGVQASPPVIQVPPQGQQFAGFVQQGGNNAGLGVRPGVVTEPLAPRTADGSASQASPHVD